MKTRCMAVWVGLYVALNMAAYGVSSQEWLTGWRDRIPVTINNAEVEGDLANFPVLVRLNSNNFSFASARADGYDIRFTAADGRTQLSYERERHDASAQKAEYWVRLPTISNTTDTLFYLYYGNASAADGQATTNVWDSGFLGVWHLNGTNGINQSDSTAGSNNLTGNGSIQVGGEGVIGTRVDMPGETNTSYLIGPSRTFGTTNGITLSAWALPRRGDEDGNAYGLIAIGGGGWAPYYETFLSYMPYRAYPGSQLLDAKSYVWPSDKPNGGLQESYLTGFTSGQWAHVAMTCYYDPVTSNSAYRVFLNGVKRADSTNAYMTLRQPDMTRPVVLGARTGSYYPTVPPSVNFNGLLDETRLANVARSEAWVLAEYSNQKTNSAFVSFAAVENAPRWQAAWLRGWGSRMPLAVNSSEVQVTLTNFPVLVRLTTNNFDFTAARADGYDIRFTASDGLTLLSYERERHDADAKKAEYWVRLPVISNGAETIFGLYYGNGNASDGQNASNVWDSGFLGVWHLNGTNGINQSDSTAGSNNLTGSGSIQVGGEGVIGTRVDMPGETNTSYLLGPSRTFGTTNGMTLSTWALPRRGDNSSEAYGLITIGSVGWGPYYETSLSYMPYKAGYGTQLFAPYTSVWTGDKDNGGIQASYLTGFTSGQWAHVAMTCYYDPVASNSTYRVFLNGVKRADSTIAYMSLRQPDMDRPVVLGGRGAVPGVNFDGLLDETHMANVARSEAWIRAEYSNQKTDGAFVIFADPEAYLPQGTVFTLR